MSNPNSPKHGLQKRKTVTQEKKIAEDEFMAAAIGDVEWLRQSLRGQKGVINFDRNGLAPLHLAAIHGRVDCLKLLIEKFKIDANTPSATGWRPVHLCISNQTGKRAYQSLSYLLSRGADPSMPNDDGITPMHQAASEGHVQCLKALIEAGGKVWEKDDRGHTPIDLAKLWGHRKCARILATENWHQSKQFLATEMLQLQKVKMQQILKDMEKLDQRDYERTVTRHLNTVLEDMEKADQREQDQAFYGDQAFNEWLTSRGLPKHEPKEKTPPPPPPQKKKGSDGEGKKEPEKESTYKANGMRRPPAKNAPSPIKEEAPGSPPGFTARRDTFVSPELDEYGDPIPRSAKTKTKSATESKHPTISDKDSLWYNPDTWNKSTKLPGKEYEPLLPDHYPHDEYTMMPKNPAQRKDFNKSPLYAKGTKGKTGSATTAGSKVSMPKLPADVIDRKLHPEKYERPVVYKCKHIADVHKREMYPVERLPRQEAGMHLMDNMDSFLFKRGLVQLQEIPAALRTPASQANRESIKFADFMERMTKPTIYPRITGPEHKIPAGV